MLIVCIVFNGIGDKKTHEKQECFDEGWPTVVSMVAKNVE